MAKNWTHIRVETSTLAQLDRVRRSMLIAEEMGMAELVKDDRDRFALDQVLKRLIAFRDRHHARVRKAKANRALKRRAAAAKDEAQITAPLLRSAPEEE